MMFSSSSIRMATAALTFACIIAASNVFAQTDPAATPAPVPEAAALTPKPVETVAVTPVAATEPTPVPTSTETKESVPVAKPSVLPAASTAAPVLPQPPGPWYRIRAVAELGFLAVLSHKLQFGNDGTYFDYVREGGQDNLYAIARMSLELELKRRHTFVFLYQPLELVTSVALPRDVRIAGAEFPQGTPVELRYGFPFYRASYLYDLVKSPKHELSIGLSMQIRNATIDFKSQDGKIFTSNRNIGPVPILKSRGRYSFERGGFLGYEVDGFYAPISVINGSDNEVTGAIVDLSLRGGLALPANGEMFLNLRYLAGGAVGQSDPEPTYDGYTKNWLHFMTVSIGAAIGTF